MSDSAAQTVRSATAPRSLWRFWAPRHWPVWGGIALLRLLGWLPRRAQLVIGRTLGRMAMPWMRSRRRIARRNLAVAFPELDPRQRRRLLREHFADLGIALCDTALAWWGSPRRLAGLLQLEGVEHLEQARAQGRGVLLLTGHYTSMELSGRLFGRHHPAVAIYRNTGQPLLDEIMRRGRSRGSHRLVSKRAVGRAVVCLRRGDTVWLAMDHATIGGDNTVIAPFFNYPSVTSTSPSRIAAATGAATLLVFAKRLPDGGCQVRISPALANFPSADWAADAQRLNRLLEAQIREAPSQYFWVHRCFKGDGDIYGAESRLLTE